MNDGIETRARGLAWRTLTVGLALALGPLGAAMAAGPSSQFTVTGAVQTPASYDAAALAMLPSVTQTDSFSAGGGAPQTHIYSGPLLSDVLNASGVLTTPGVKNDILNKVVLATGSDGYSVVYSLGELNTSFGNRPDLVASAETIGGITQPLGADGFARLTAPGDVKGGRYVSNLVNLDVRASGSTQAGTGGGLSTSFSVSGAVAAPVSFDLAALQGLTPITETVGGLTYTGVSFWDFLSKTVGISLDPTVKNDVLNKYVVATGSDGYKVAFSLGELSSDFGNQPDMIAYAVDGQSLGSNGFARIVVPGDVKAGRWVSNLVSLEVLSATAAAVPEPQAWALMLFGLIGLSAVAKAKARR